jgi:hypothetical protein
MNPHEVERAKADLIEAKRLDAAIMAMTAYRNLITERAHITLQNYERQRPGVLTKAWGYSSEMPAAHQLPAEALKQANYAPLPTGPPNGNGN